MSIQETITMNLYDGEVIDLLQQAVEEAKVEAAKNGPIRSKYHFGYELETEDNDTINVSDSSSSGEESEGREDADTSSQSNDSAPALGSDAAPDSATTAASASTGTASKPKRKKRQPTNKQRDALLRQAGKPPLVDINTGSAQRLQLPSHLLSLDTRKTSDKLQICQSYFNLATSLSKKAPVLVLMLRSGRFAGAVFQGTKCVQHTTSTRYTIRKGQGKAQSTQDGSRRPKSMGSQLRRAGELALEEDVAKALDAWSSLIDRAALLLISSPVVMRKVIWQRLSKDDERIRYIPLDVGRPTFEATSVAHQVMMQVYVGEQESSPEASKKMEVAAPPELVQEPAKPKISEPAASPLDKIKSPDPLPLTAVHEAARDGNTEELLKCIDDTAAALNSRTGPDWMTPLHFAAQGEHAECVELLLVEAGADPALHDARHRVPYYLATNEATRLAFRKARARLGEDRWDWATSKVGPPLTEDDLASKKQKAAEKKKRQRQRQKEKKAREKAEAEAAEQARQVQQEEAKQAEEAKRVRDGLKAKSTANNACDFCGKVTRGMRRSQMFQRLEYVYCSTDCVQKHKRELMAKAALARFGG